MRLAICVSVMACSNPASKPGAGADAGQIPVAGAPVLLFADLVSGPSHGNSDDSQPGQVAGQDGAIVTVWGKHLGVSPDVVTIGGVRARVYTWSNATAPADLFTRHQMQMVSFQVPSTVANGLTNIEVVVAGVASNSIPFTVRDGDIRFAMVGGDDDAGDGSWTKPWAKVSAAVTHLAPGDILYLGDGVAQTDEDGDRSSLDLDHDPAQLGTQALPKALVGYPGATAQIGSATLDAWSTFVSGAPTPATYWTIAKLTLAGQDTAATYNTGFRLVGDHLSAPNGDQPTGAIGGIDSTDLFVLGNELTNCGYAGTSKLYHPMYIQSTESDTAPRLPDSVGREIGWNYLHDNQAFDGINIYREGQYSAYMTKTLVHDNVVENQTGRGMLIGNYVTGADNYIYNNLIIRAGLGPAPAGSFASDPAYGYVCVDIDAGADDNPATTIHFYNNTLYNCGFAGGPANTAGSIAVGDSYPFQLDFRNNLVVATSGFPFAAPDSVTTSTAATANLWFGDGGPVSDPSAAELFAGAVTGDPMLANPSADDLRLTPGSAAVDRGDSSTPVPAADFDNVPRPAGAGYDIGAFELP